MLKKYKNANIIFQLALLFGLVVLLSPLHASAVRPADEGGPASAPAGTCQHVVYVGSQQDSNDTTACTNDDYKTVLNSHIQGVTKSNEKNYCYRITERIGGAGGSNAQKVDCSSLTLTTCASLGETGTYPNCNSGGSGGGGSSGGSGGASASNCNVNNPPAICTDPATDCSTAKGGKCDFIGKYINPAINTLTVLFGLLAAISIILGGINYATSEGDPQKASKAKRRIANTIIAIVAYMFLYAFLQFIVPGGIFN